MDVQLMWQNAKEVIKDLVNYGLPLAAFIVSIVSLKRSNKSQEVKIKLSAVETQLQKYELELKKYMLKEIAEEEDKKDQACVEARLIHIAAGKYKLKIWNSGKATAYKVDFDVLEKDSLVISKTKEPYEFLDSGKNFEETAFIHLSSSPKFKITTRWEDSSGKQFSKENLCSI